MPTLKWPSAHPQGGANLGKLKIEPVSQASPFTPILPPTSRFGDLPRCWQLGNIMFQKDLKKGPKWPQLCTVWLPTTPNQEQAISWAMWLKNQTQGHLVHPLPARPTLFVVSTTFAKTTSKHANTRQNTHVSCGTSRQCAASSWVSFMPNCRITPPPPPRRKSETQRLPCATHATPSKYTAVPNINRQRRPAHTGATRQASGVRRPSPRERGRPLPPPMRKR